MKKLFYVTAFVFAGLIAQAQMNYGIKAGANFSNWGGDDADEAKSKVGFHGGFFVGIAVNEMFSVQPELLYSAEGTKYEEAGETAKFNLNYLNLPVMFRYNNPSGFFAETGPQIGFLMSAESKFDDGTGEIKEDIKDQLKSTNFSWNLGLGFKSKAGFGIGARYSFGLGNIVDAPDADVKQSNIAVGLFYVLGAKK